MERSFFAHFKLSGIHYYKRSSKLAKGDCTNLIMLTTNLFCNNSLTSNLAKSNILTSKLINLQKLIHVSIFLQTQLIKVQNCYQKYQIEKLTKKWIERVKKNHTSQVILQVSMKDLWKNLIASSASCSVRNPKNPNCLLFPSLLKT